MRRVETLLAAALLVACAEPTPAAPEALGERFAGAWGQNEQHAAMNTTGLELAGTTLSFGELTITITRGAMTGPDDYRVDEAEVGWKKDSKPPRKCSGTLARQGNVLLVKLFREGSDARCESVLDGEWRSWTLGTQLPESMFGIYGADARSEAADVGVRLSASGVAFTDGGTELKLDELLVYVDKPDIVYVRKATYGDVTCSGTISLDDGRMLLKLTAAAGGPPGPSCPSGDGKLWTVDKKFLPTQALDNGKVEISSEGDRIAFVSRDGLACTQQVLQTAARSVTGSSWDGIPVSGGAVFVLHAADPVGAERCTAKLRTLADQLCADPYDTRCLEARLAVDEPVVCPRQIVIGDQVPGGRKAAVLPASVQNLACWDMTGMFVAKK